MLTDFNDLHLAAGLDAVRDQIHAALARRPETVVHEGEGETGACAPPEAPPPAPPAQEGAGDWTVERLLQRFALIEGETKVFDHHKHRVMRKTAFADLVGKVLAKQWMDHPGRRYIDRDAVQQLIDDRVGRREQAALDRFVYIYPTKECWDYQIKDRVTLEALRALIPTEYDLWLRSPKRRVIRKDQLVFDPQQTKDPATHINTFVGLPLRPVNDRLACRGILKLLDHLCNDDLEVVDWVLRWLAYPLQNVGAKMATALMVHSSIQGSGKSLFFDAVMRPIYGIYGATLGQHQLESQYTDWRENKLYALFEEVLSRSEKYSRTGEIKHMITGTTQRIEKKFLSGWEQGNHMNCVFLSNELQPIPLEVWDRRFTVIWPERKLPPDLQQLVHDELANGGCEAFYGHLLALSLRGFGPHTKPPDTLARRRLIDFSLSGIELFVREWQAGLLDVPYQSCKTRSLYTFYKQWCSQTGERAVREQNFSGHVALVAQKALKWWRTLTNKGQCMCFIVGEPPADIHEIDWLGEQIQAFDRALNAAVGGGG